MTPNLPAGRGAYIWRLPLCEGGDLARVVDRCRRARITWLAVKAGDQGRAWRQFTPELVATLHAARLRVFGWSYDVPSRVAAQIDVARHVAACGADGYIADCEIEWDQDAHPDVDAARESAGLAALASPAFQVADAPWDVIAAHGRFPFTAFAPALSFRCPQVYHLAHGLSVAATWDRFLDNWTRYAGQHPDAVRPLLPSLSTWEGVRVAAVAEAERRAQAAGFAGVIHWVWERIPREVWAAFESGEIPAFGG